MNALYETAAKMMDIFFVFLLVDTTVSKILTSKGILTDNLSRRITLVYAALLGDKEAFQRDST